MNLNTSTEILGIYAINMTYYPQAQSLLENHSHPLARLFCHALIDPTTQETLTDKINFLEILPEEMRNFGPMQETLRTYKKIQANFQEKIVQEKYDVCKIKTIINKILKIEAEEIESGIREDFFNKLKESQFLTIEASSLQEVRYHPGKHLRAMLVKNPSVDTFLLGCGKKVLTSNSMCYEHPKRQLSHHERALTINLHSDIDPDVIANMHDPQLWEGSENESLQMIADHTNMTIMFDDSHSDETLSLIYQKLKRNGILDCAFPLTSEQRMRLENIGFKAFNHDFTQAIK